MEIVERPLILSTMIREVYRRWYFRFLFSIVQREPNQVERKRWKKYEMTHQSHKNLNSIWSVIRSKQITKTEIEEYIHSKSPGPETTSKIMCHTNNRLIWPVLCLATWDNAKYERHSPCYTFIHFLLFFPLFRWKRCCCCSFFFVFSTNFSHFILDFAVSIFLLFGPSHLNSTITFYLAFGSIVAFCLLLTLDPCHIKQWHM